MKKLHYPFNKEEIRKLKVGDMVLISGKLFTGRDAVHHRIHNGTPPPVSFENQIIYGNLPICTNSHQNPT